MKFAQFFCDAQCSALARNVDWSMMISIDPLTLSDRRLLNHCSRWVVIGFSTFIGFPVFKYLYATFQPPEKLCREDIRGNRATEICAYNAQQLDQRNCI